MFLLSENISPLELAGQKVVERLPRLLQLKRALGDQFYG